MRRCQSLEVKLNGFRATILAGLLLPAFGLAEASSILPKDLCDTLPPIADQETLQQVLRTAPHLFTQRADGAYSTRVPLRKVPRAVAIDLIAGAASRGWSGIDFVSDPGFQRTCAYFLDRDVIEALDTVFNMGLSTPFSGVSTGGDPFQMTSMVLGSGQLAMRYDHRRVRYKHGETGRTLSALNSLYFKINVVQEGGETVKYLQDIKNLGVHTGFPFGWESVGKIRKRGGVDHSWVLGKWRGGTPSVAITRRPAPDLWDSPMGSASVMLAPAEDLALSARPQGLLKPSASLDALRTLSGTVPVYVR